MQSTIVNPTNLQPIATNAMSVGTTVPGTKATETTVPGTKATETILPGTKDETIVPPMGGELPVPAPNPVSGEDVKATIENATDICSSINDCYQNGLCYWCCCCCCCDDDGDGDDTNQDTDTNCNC